MSEKIITLVGEDYAVEGKSFVFMGGQIECTACSFNKICLNLEKGQKYTVINVRPPVHDCDLTEGKVRVVEVVKASRSVCVEKKYAIDGSFITFFPSGCGQIGCKHYHQCNPDGVDSEQKVKIDIVEGKAECLIGQNRNVVTIG